MADRRIAGADARRRALTLRLTEGPSQQCDRAGFIDAVTAPFHHRGSGRKSAYAAPFLMSNESSSMNARTVFRDGGHLAGIQRGA
jgi:hypothetical protein